MRILLVLRAVVVTGVVIVNDFLFFVGCAGEAVV